jgi:hypothetical protein
MQKDGQGARTTIVQKLEQNNITEKQSLTW